MPSVELKSVVEMLAQSVPDFSDDIHELRIRFADLASRNKIDAGITISHRTVGGVGVIETSHAPDLHTTILFFHGGAYVAGSATESLSLSSEIGVVAGAKVVSVDYRLAPEHPYPAGVQDSLNVYAQLIEDGTNPESIVVAGASAGGGLAITLLIAAKAQGLPMPGACVVFSPWIDLELTGESLRTRADVDPSLTVNGLRRAATDYLHGRSPRHSGANALHASLAGLPPMFIQVGSREILFDDSIRLAAHAGTAGVSVELQCWPEMVHVFQAFAAQLPEGRAALQAAGAFIRTKVTP
ncbi:alpha/beta hydrolase [Arthrobacter sp. Hiyo1]|uniref:alpha/beta hydrolase n=1 Tax=Arthrobacter sp. Hiyo1 TaxID=1588020 RepID=UPI000AED8EC9|nr:alpha/beta hydrolase [Arthrobacter sp. Hiyo1]